ncbi:oligosaccharide flippase family protein [Parabacteroides sp.]
MNLNSNKRLFVNLCANIVSYSTNILIAFVLTPYLINTLGKETYSFYPMANNFVAYMAILTNALNSMSSRFVTFAIVQHREDDAKKYVSSVFFSNIIMSVILLLPMLAIVMFVDNILEVPINIEASIKILFSFVFASMLVNIVSSIFGIAIFVKNRIDLRSIMQLVSGVLKCILFYALFRLFTPTIIYVGVVALIVAFYESFVQQYYFKRLLPNFKISLRYFSKRHVKEILSSGSWNSVNAIGSLLMVNSSIIMANIYYGATAGGVYSIVNTVPLFINGVISMLVGVFAPIVTYSYAEGNKDVLLQNMEKAQAMIGLFSCSVSIVFISISPQFFSLWTPAEDARQLFELSAITIVPHFFIGCLWPLTNLNTAANKVATPALVQLGLGIVNIIITIIITSLFNTSLVTISLVSTGLSLIFVAVFLPLYASAYLNIPCWRFYKVPLRMVIGSAILITLFLFTVRNMSMSNWLSLIFTSVLMGVIAFTIYFLFLPNRTMQRNLIVKFRNTTHL